MYTPTCIGVVVAALCLLRRALVNILLHKPDDTQRAALSTSDVLQTPGSKASA